MDDIVTEPLGHRCAALIVIGSDLKHAGLKAVAERSAVPLVDVGYGRCNQFYDVVRSSGDKGIEQLIEYLAELGHRQITYVDSASMPPGSLRRRDIEEAGMIDGLSSVGAFVRLVLPSNLGAVVAVGVFAIVLSWSEVLFASVLTTDKTQTLSIALSSVVAQPLSPIHWNNIMAASIIASVPIVVAFALVQKRFVQGLSTGAVKG